MEDLVTGLSFYFIFILHLFQALNVGKPNSKYPGGGVSGKWFSGKIRKRGHAPFFVGESKKRVRVGDFPTEDANSNNLRSCSTIGCAGKGYPPVPYFTWSKVARLCNLRKYSGRALFFFPIFSLFFFLFLGSWLPHINLLSPESAPQAFSRIPIPSLYGPRDSHVAPRRFEFGSHGTKDGYST